jgi:ATP-binding cassette subfamily F protein 3
VLFAEPDLLLLDEPTNHLDLEATLWLEGFLARYPRTLIIVSHDRTLLNGAVDHILQLDRGRLALYRGDYDRFERQRREQLSRQAALHARQEAQRRRLQAFIDRFRAKATKARQAQSRVKMLARLEPIAAVMEDPAIAFSFPEPEPLPSPLIALEGCAAGYAPTQPVLARLDLRIDADDRIALLGANGNGKSTLARLLAGRLRPLAGALRASAKLKVGYFAQHQMEELAAGRTAYQHLAALAPEAPEDRLRARLAQFGLAQDKANVPAAELSGGEKARLVFALITWAAPHLLILDEPSNHLDIDGREALAQAINEFAGAVVLVSHDRHLLDATADRLWLVEGGTVRPFDGDLDDYARRLAEGRRTAAAPAKPAAPTRRDERRAAAETRAQLAPLRRRAREAEALVERLGNERAALDAALAAPDTYSNGGARVAELGRQRAEVARRLAEAEAEWLAAHEAIEEAERETSA